MPMNPGADKSKMRLKSTRKPLRDVSNAKVSTKHATNMKKNSETDGRQMVDESLDRLLLVQSDLSSLVRQIDELVVQALQLTGNKGRKEIKQFADALSDMQTTLKPWVPRLHKALFTQSTRPEHKSEQLTEITTVPEESKNAIFQSPDQTKLESLISPSPLVSWRAGCNKEGVRQLFLLTPLPQQRGPFSLKRQAFENVEAKENIEAKCGTPANIYEENRQSTLVMTTPCLRMSPPKSCILLEPISEFAKKKTLGAYKLTPFPVRARDSDGSQDSDSSGSQSLAVKYPELFGIKLNHLEKKAVEEEDPPYWIVSPPKTCVIMEPADEKLLLNTTLRQRKDAGCDQQDHLPAVNKVDYHEDHATIGCKLDLVFCGTPMIKEEPMSKQPGENTLKKELWTRFEAATACGVRFGNTSLQDTTTTKGFLGRLDEALES